MNASRPLVAFVRGDDASLVRDATVRAVDDAIGGAVPASERSLMVDEFAGDDYELRALIDAAQTPPLFTPHRVVVGRDLERFGVDALAPLLHYLADPLESTSLVLVWSPGGGRVPKALTDALKAAGAEMVNATVPSGRGRQQWFDDEVSASGLRLDAPARRLLAAQLGDDLARLSGLLAALVSAFGPGARVDTERLTPFLGEAGGVPPWELTHAIDQGDAGLAVERLRRMTGAGGRHPLQVMVTLHSHVERMLRLQGSGVASEQQAAALLGMKGSTFPARKALNRMRALGPERLGRAVVLLGEADVALRGGQGWPAEQVLEVLVARLARLGR
jgi:DNA polymerase-3 subunit delta